MNLLDLFSGIGGFSLGLKSAGIKIDKHFNSDIDTYANAVYKYNFKDSKHVGSVTDIQGNKLPKIDIITFGSPCQDFSLAGRRSGMEGERSSLITQAIRLIRKCRPSVFIWENVKGTFSTNDGKDFWAILQEFTNIGGYRLEWQLLNTKWILPQNRERLYLVGHLAEGHSKKVFPITKNDTSDHEVKFQGKKTKGCKQRVSNNKGRGGHTMYKVGDYRYDEGFRVRKDGNAPTQLSQSGGKKTLLERKNTLRRLTPIECERLQGFPDNWTKYGNFDGKIKKISDTQRYKQCGNAVTVDVVEIIFKKILL